MSNPSRIGLFGGTFDPVHYGHLRPALELAERYALETLYLLPNHEPTHRAAPGATTQQRIDMLELAIRGVDTLQIDTREARRDTPTFTLDTVRELRAEQPDATLLFFMGLDAFSGFGSWHQWQEILLIANLVVIDRPDTAMSSFSRELMRSQAHTQGEQIMNGSTGVIEQQTVTQFAISATDIRNRVAAGRSIRFLLPDVVREYIEARQLYR